MCHFISASRSESLTLPYHTTGLRRKVAESCQCSLSETTNKLDILECTRFSFYGETSSEKSHTQLAPYDWNDFLETSKDQATKTIAKSGLERTAYYWNLKEPMADSQVGLRNGFCVVDSRIAIRRIVIS
ncbi:f1bd9be6-cf96-4a2d-89f7-7bd11e19cc14 [Sclerotinia trifoliorum]|uniref:F1bd9be6-cf96-4a2d-89f7-7bd11e19cc14 n=1 Tax=Sclerotinia trifoliorum TaxID=28548 RepID=A0A8H2W4K3_9HELO|nr:f1bd9be6-cf96-4a2d-89f7-7bd11e19cc14 [Sclerotinia trifoliorum]